MLTTKEFENLINSQESSILDFKLTIYDLSDENGTSKLIKDIICFTNTVRNDTSYIITGIGEKDDKSKDLVGLSKIIDDSLLQDKVKDKVYPRPIFNYYTINYREKSFGIFEFPVTKYPLPISPTIKMKGLEIGRIYFRKGTTNAEAIGHEVITIGNWLQNLPAQNEIKSIHDEVTELIKRLTSGNERLSLIIIDLLKIARKHELIELVNFCSFEIKGIDIKTIDSTSDEYQYRVQKVQLSRNKIEINPYAFVRATETMVRNEMENSKDFYNVRFFISKPLNEIEETLDAFTPETLCMTTKLNSRDILNDKKGSDYIVFMYAFKDSYISLYKNIRQKAIDELMKL